MARMTYDQMREAEIRRISKDSGLSYNLVARAYDDTMTEDRGSLTRIKKSRMELVARVAKIYQNAQPPRRTNPREIALRIDYPTGVGITVSGFDEEDDPAATGKYIAELVKAQVHTVVGTKRTSKDIERMVLDMAKENAEKRD